MKFLPEMYRWTKTYPLNLKNHAEFGPPSRPKNAQPDQINIDWIFMKSLPEIHFWTRKSQLNFGSHLETTTLCQGPTISYLAR